MPDYRKPIPKSQKEISNNQVESKYESYFFNNYAQVVQKTNELDIVKSYYKNDPRPLINLNKKEFLADRVLEILIYARHLQSIKLRGLYSRLLEASSTGLYMSLSACKLGIT